MKTSDACLFLVVGILMWAAPLLAPGHFPQSGPGLINPSSLWLQVMGWVNGGLGALFLLCARLTAALRRLAGVAERQTVACAQLLRPPLPRDVKASLAGRARRHLAA